MNFYVTKYALTSGLMTFESIDYEVKSGTNMLRPKAHVPFGFRHFFHVEGKEWHRTEEAAIARAEEMRVAKIASLKRQMAKLEKLDFNAKEKS